MVKRFRKLSSANKYLKIQRKRKNYKVALYKIKSGLYIVGTRKEALKEIKKRE